MARRELEKEMERQSETEMKCLDPTRLRGRQTQSNNFGSWFDG